MLEKLILFEYINGDDESTKNTDKKDRNKEVPWNAVNPFLRELAQFEKAKEQLLKSEEEPKPTESLG